MQGRIHYHFLDIKAIFNRRVSAQPKIYSVSIPQLKSAKAQREKGGKKKIIFHGHVPISTGWKMRAFLVESASNF